MGTINAFPETETKALQNTGKFAFFSPNDSSEDLLPSTLRLNLNSSSFVTDEVYDCYAFAQNDFLSKSNSHTLLHLGSCGFPYYRSNQSSGCKQDAVLLKDVGVSCTLLDEKLANLSSPRSSGMENYFVKRLKTEYSDLTNITRKISAYTKEIIRNLSLKKHHQQMQSKPTINQLSDSKNAFWKMKMHDRTEHITSFDTVHCNESTNVPRRSSKDKKSNNKYFYDETINPAVNSTTSSSSFILYDYLMMDNKKEWERMPRKGLLKSNDAALYRKPYVKSTASSKHSENNVKQQHRPTMFTNWQEISKINSNFMVKNDFNTHCNEFNEKFGEQLTLPTPEKYLQNTNFHTVNIRILKRKQYVNKLLCK